MARRLCAVCSTSRRWVLALTAGFLLHPAAIEAQEHHPLPGAVYSSGVTSPAGATLVVVGGIAGDGADVRTAAADALQQAEQRLSEVGLGRDDILRVRAGLAPGAGDGAEFEGWNEAWTEFFPGEDPPARTTVGASATPEDAPIVLDVTAAYPAGAGHPATLENVRATLNPNVFHAGPSENPTVIASTRAGLFFSSGILPGVNQLEDVESMEEQMRSTMNRLTSTLFDHGLQWQDVFFVRVLPTPQPERADVDFAAWAPVRATLDDMTAGNAPGFVKWAAPGFSSTQRYVEVEVWAVPHAPQAVFATFDQESQNPNLRMTGTGFIAGGAHIAPNAELVWLSGVVAPEGTAPEDEGAATLAVMEERLQEMGASMADVAELRVYRIEGEEGFGDAYGEHFNNPENNPHRPVRTNYLVENLPGNRLVEVEAVIVLPPRSF